MIHTTSATTTKFTYMTLVCAHASPSETHLVIYLLLYSYVTIYRRVAIFSHATR